MFQVNFDSTLGDGRYTLVQIELKHLSSKPTPTNSYPVPKAQKKELKVEIQRLVNYKVLNKVNNYVWVSPVFTKANPNGSLRQRIKIRERTNLIRRYPFLIPKTQDVHHKLKCFM